MPFWVCQNPKERGPLVHNDSESLRQQALCAYRLRKGKTTHPDITNLWYCSLPQETDAMSAKMECHHHLPPHLCLLVFLILVAVHAHAQSAPIGVASDILSCSPAPCVLPPIQATSGSFFGV